MNNKSSAERLIESHYNILFGFEEDINEDNFYIPDESEYESFECCCSENETEEEYDIAIAKPGLWENIRKKKQREGKNYRPAKPGDKDRPDPKSWKKAQSNDGEMQISQLQKMSSQLMEIVEFIKKNPLEFEEWTKDKISKSEHFIEEIHSAIFYGNLETSDEYKAEAAEKSKVKLNKPFRTPKGPKKFSVYVKNDKGNVVKVNFGDPNMSIKRDDPARRKSFRARHNCDTNPGPKWKAKYWSCRQWRENAPVEAKKDDKK